LKRFNNDFSELTKNVSFLTQVHGLSPGSEIWDREKPIPDPDPGVKKALDTGSGSATPLTARPLGVKTHGFVVTYRTKRSRKFDGNMVRVESDHN
jgi:hypothetical protein